MDILVVDDNEIAQQLVCHALQREGHRVLVACNGQEALNILSTRPCRLVISDWVMPEMDGVELCRQIRSATFSNYIYIILLTTRNRTPDIVEGISAGADDFLVKPFQAAELCVRVRAGERILQLETRDLIIFAMAKLAESRDQETGTHLERICNYALILAQHLAEQPEYRTQIEPGFAQMIHLTSPLHDIGKVGIPDGVLLKPGRLSAAEFEIMKQHTTIGAETLDAVLRQHPDVSFLRMARDIALCHHERFNGTGYPNGLVGRDIPLCGRIVALADVYDALTTKRVYKDAYTHAVARETILQECGKHFDPDMVEAFIQNEERFVAMLRQFSGAESEALCA
ncbi:MAG: response regulator [Planctomycetes bacterium]|nr:response regulator [Planctomycetota bacterium]